MNAEMASYPQYLKKVTEGNTKTKNCRGISILNTCYNIYSKILNLKLQNYSELFMTGIQNGFRKGRSCMNPTF